MGGVAEEELVENLENGAELANETSKVPEQVHGEAEAVENVAPPNSAPSEVQVPSGAASRAKQRLMVMSKGTSVGRREAASDAKADGDAKNSSGAAKPFDPEFQVPNSAMMLITPNLHSLLAFPSHFSIDPATPERLAQLRNLAKSNTGIALIYTHSIAYQETPDVQSRAYFGMYCAVSAVTKHKTLQRGELTLVPLRRIKVPADVTPRSFAVGAIEEWPSFPMAPADVDDIIVAAMPLLPNPIVLPFKPIASNPLVAQMTLHRIMAHILDSISRHDPFGVLQLMQQAFVERSLDLKLEDIQRALGMTTISHELTHSIDEINERRKWQSLEQQMEKLIRHQLADPKKDPELKLAQQIAELPEHLRAMAHKEFEHMKSLEPSGSEHGVVASYLDWLVNIPWNKRTEDRFDMAEAKEILDRSHHGLEDVKVKILQLMANASRTGKISAKPLLFVGPPGTGKTSFAKAIADALGRKFISLAGLTETNDLRGHRRTYVGSVPGKIAYEMRRCGSKNPVIVIDEVDKIEDGQRFRPLTPALLELLSPDQNKTFYDQYLDVGIDCSEVLFICTANSQEAISSPLLNRLQVVDLRAYSSTEKFDIAKHYVLPKVMEESGLKAVTMPDESIKYLVEVYSKHEAGVRQIRRHMQHMMRQLAVKAVEDPRGGAMPFELSKEAMVELLEAPESVRGDRVYDEAIVGVVNGLSKNMYGGSTLTIEAIADLSKSNKHKKTSAKSDANDAENDSASADGGRGVHFTGNIMETMKESSSIAYTYAKSFMAQYFPENDFFKNAALHVHVPFGLVKKDGPSAGCALVCAFLSVAFNRPLSTTLCMTGEITLSGRVTAVGGIREKMTAAAQHGMTEVILPLSNKSDYEAIPSELVASLTPHFVSTYEEAFAVAFKMQLKAQKTRAVQAANPAVSKRKIVTKNAPESPLSKDKPNGNSKEKPNTPSKSPKPNVIHDIEEKRTKIPISAVPSL